MTNETYQEHSLLCLYSEILRENTLQNDIGNVCLISVVNTDFWINKNKPFWKSWFLFKFKGPGVCCELAFSIRDSGIVRCHGPLLYGQWSDIKVPGNTLIKDLKNGKKVDADMGYREESHFINYQVAMKMILRKLDPTKRKWTRDSNSGGTWTQKFIGMRLQSISLISLQCLLLLSLLLKMESHCLVCQNKEISYALYHIFTTVEPLHQIK